MNSYKTLHDASYIHMLLDAHRFTAVILGLLGYLVHHSLFCIRAYEWQGVSELARVSVSRYIAVISTISFNSVDLSFCHSVIPSFRLAAVRQSVISASTVPTERCLMRGSNATALSRELEFP